MLPPLPMSKSYYRLSSVFTLNFSKLKLQLIRITADNTLQGWRKGQLWRKPHATLLLGRKGAVLQKIEKGGYFSFQLLQKVGIITFKTLYLPDPISGFYHIYDDWE